MFSNYDLYENGWTKMIFIFSNLFGQLSQSGNSFFFFLLNVYLQTRSGIYKVEGFTSPDINVTLTSLPEKPLQTSDILVNANSWP